MKIIMNPIGKILSIFSLVGLIGCTDIDSRDAMKYGSMNYQEVIKAVETPAQVRAYILSNIHSAGMLGVSLCIMCILCVPI